MSDYPVPDSSDFDLLQILRALADPIRLDILMVLADGEPHPKRTGAWAAGVTKSTMSHHFKVLREAGLTRTLVEGRTQSCQLRRAELDERFPGLVEALTRPGGSRARRPRPVTPLRGGQEHPRAVAAAGADGRPVGGGTTFVPWPT